MLLALALCLPVQASTRQDDPQESEPKAPGEQDSRPADEQPEHDGENPFDLDMTFRLDPVIVTARKWDEDAQDVPQSLTVISGSTIRDAGIRSVREASFLVPNVHLTEFTARRLSFPSIRGITSGVGDPAVTTFIDGVPQLTVSSANIALLDVERIEFLRGPQGTLYGRNSIGGLIHIITKRPGNTLEIRSSAIFGNFDLQEYTLGVSGPLIKDELFFSVSGLYSERDGYTTNGVTGNDIDNRESFFGRGQLVWTPDDRSEFRLSIYGERSRDGAFPLFELDALRDRPFHIAHDFEGKSDRELIAPALTWNYHGDTVEITSISAVVDLDISERADFDFTAIDAIRRRTEEEQTYFSQELRISSPTDAPVILAEGLKLHWLVGGQAFVSDSKRLAANDFRPGGVGIFFPPAAVGLDTAQGDFDDFSLAVFGQTTLSVDDTLDLTVGLRYDYEDKEADLRRTFETRGFTIVRRDTRLDKTFDEFVPKFSVAYHLNEDVMVYGRAAKGFKAGGFNLDAPTGGLAFGPEKSWTYEAGIKTTWWDDRLQLNASVFYIDWDDLQISLFDPVAGGFIDNAADATSQGFEIELLARPTRGLDVFAGLGFTDAEIDSFVDQFGVDVSGKKIANVPDLTWHIGAQFTGEVGRAGRWFVRGEYIDVGTFFYDAGNRRSERYGLANFRVGYERPNFRIEGWIKNAFDDEYVLVAFQPSPIDPGFFVGENGAPRAYGVTLSFRF